MEKKSVFDTLVAQLLMQERLALLEQLTSDVEADISPEIKWEPPVADPPVLWQESYNSLGLWTKLLLFLAGLFQTQGLQGAVERYFLKRLEREILQQCPGFVNFRLEVFETPFYLVLKSLFDGLKAFRHALVAALEGQKGEFVAFYTGLACPEVQEHLLLDTDFWYILEKNPDMPTRDIKKLAENNLAAILKDFPPEKKKTLSEEMLALSALWKLSQFPADNLLGAFSGGSGNDGHLVAAFMDLQAPLEELLTRINGLKVLPKKAVVEAVFLFYHQGKMAGEGTELEPLLAEAMKRAVNGLASIKDFRHKVPLSKIVRRLNKELNLGPPPFAGAGENWFLLYRRFWEGRLERNYQAFSKFRSEKLLLSEICGFLNTTPETWIKNHPFPLPQMKGTFLARGNKRLAFVHVFWESVFVPKIKPLMMLILKEGMFFKKKDKEDFAAVFHQLCRVSESHMDFYRNFADGGLWGSLIEELAKEADDGVKRGRIDEIFAMASQAIDQWFESVLPLFKSADIWINSLLGGENSRGRDKLINLTEIAGRSNALFRRELEQDSMLLGRFNLLLKDLSAFD